MSKSSQDGWARRTVVTAGVALATAAAFPVQAREEKTMYGLIGQMLAAPGKRDALIAILTESTQDMPGCLSYILAQDATNADSHAASLKLPAVQAAIAKARPIIAGFGQRFETVPVGGVGLG